MTASPDDDSLTFLSAKRGPVSCPATYVSNWRAIADRSSGGVTAMFRYRGELTHTSHPLERHALIADYSWKVSPKYVNSVGNQSEDRIVICRI